MNFHNLIGDSAAGYKLAKIISGGHYNNILIFEIHDIVEDPSKIWYWEEGLETFQNRNSEYYDIFINRFRPDDEPANISVVAKINGEWFIDEGCGSNYYNGYGPGGILAIRKACYENNVFITYSEEKLSEWIKKNISTRIKLPTDKKSEFDKIIQKLEIMKVGMQSSKETYVNHREEELRDTVVLSLNSNFKEE